MAGAPERPTALIVEDDEQIALLLRRILDVDGFEVAEVADGTLAVPAVRALRPDVLLLDIGLPGIHGLDVLAEIKSDPDIAHVPVVVVTAWWTTELQARALALGAAAAVAKPFDIARIRAAVGVARGGNPARTH